MPDQPTPQEMTAQIEALQRQLAEKQAQQASAQQGSAAAIGRSIANVGDYNVNLINELPPEVLDLFARQFGFDPHASDATALKAYFDNVVFEKHSKLSFLFIRPETGKVYTEADVETVFVPLRMTDPDAVERQARLARRAERETFRQMTREMEEAAHPITLQELLRKYPVLMLRGKPGCGKTTLLRHIALAFARNEQKEKLDWDGPAPLPLIVSLRNFGQFLKSHASRYGEPQPRAMLEYLEEHLRGAGVSFSPDFISKRLNAGECFLLLDALDEASGTLAGGGDLRAAVARQVSAFIRRYAPRGNRFALTSRPHAYEDEGELRRALREPKVCDVFDLDAQGYCQLITKLLVVLTGDEAQGRAEADDLYARITPNPHLADLAGNPLLCTTLVLVYKYRGRKLPERRVDVLHEIVTLLLGRWEEEKYDMSSPEELARMGTTAPTAEQAIQFRRRALVALAWRMQQDHAPELSAASAIQTLAEFDCNEERTERRAAEKWARDFLNVAHERSGLFIAVDEGWHAFAHQAFREYLAATHLVNAGEESLRQELLRHAPELDDWWEQVVLLAGAHPELSSGAAGRLIEALLGSATSSVGYAHLAARCAQDMTDKLPGAQRKKLQDWLVATLQADSRNLPDRALAGRALALAGDPRPGVTLSSPPTPSSLPILGRGEGARGWGEGLPDILWSSIPSGTLRMGSRRGETFQTPRGQGEPYDDEYWPDGQPRAIQIKSFKLAAYPITVAQFRPFVQDPDGWATPGWWTEAGLQDRGESKAPYYWDDPQWHIDNHPVVGITWYAAVAYCRWLTARLCAAGMLPASAVVRLPTEAEWEWAARGPAPIPNPSPVGKRQGKGVDTSPLPKTGGTEGGRRWPWGDDWREDACNSSEAQIGRTSAVGMFPPTPSPVGDGGGAGWGPVYDLAGNVWEWCSTRWQSYDDKYPAIKGVDEWTDPYLAGDNPRVVRGGSFLNVARYVRGVYRRRDYPRPWYVRQGFSLRVCVWL